MTRAELNAGWSVRRKTSIFADLQGQGDPGRDICLPHDALIDAEREEVAPGGAATGYFPGGAFEYSRELVVPEEWQDRYVAIEFEGVYRDAMVFVNDVFAGQRPNGYSRFFVELGPYLQYGETNTIRVDARAHADSRWYSGAGIHRPVHLWVTDRLHLRPEGGVQVVTEEVDSDLATLVIMSRVRNTGTTTRTVTVEASVSVGGKTASAADPAPVTVPPGYTSLVRQRIHVRNPALWGPDMPNLYSVEVRLADVDALVDAREVSHGIRRLRVDPVHGLRINGETVQLRGACIHHDNGILGAAAFREAEERRVRRLQAAGFNAIRSAHNPISEAMLDACDRLGMLVMDETFDMWAEAKSPYDYSIAFPEWWERDVESMVHKDFNHPSVIMYSIGNEIPETGSPLGAHLGRQLAEKVRGLDPTRLVTNGINGMIAALTDVVAMMRQHGADESAADGGVNALMSDPGDAMNRISASPLVSQRTAESFSVLDVAGINYGDARYAVDQEEFPNRVTVGTETFPSRIDANWALVNKYSNVVGDFTWTGWDYLGEAGLGRIQYHDEPRQFAAPFPWLTAWSGDIDLIGTRRPVSFYREVVFGLRRAPYIAVQRPQQHGRAATLGQWSWTDSLESWTWSVPDGTAVSVEVYVDADEVELSAGGQTLGRRPVGARKAFIADFEVEYRRGTLTAVAYRDGVEWSRTEIRSAAEDTRRLVLSSDVAGPFAVHGLALIEIALDDDQGTHVVDDDRVVHVEVSGPAVLHALGSARPDNPDPYSGSKHATFDGRLLAAVRPTGIGEVVVTATADGVRTGTFRFAVGSGEAAPAAAEPIQDFATERIRS